jgi:hypothetical protein
MLLCGFMHRASSGDAAGNQAGRRVRLAKLRCEAADIRGQAFNLGEQVGFTLGGRRRLDGFACGGQLCAEDCGLLGEAFAQGPRGVLIESFEVEFRVHAIVSGEA